MIKAVLKEGPASQFQEVHVTESGMVAQVYGVVKEAIHHPDIPKTPYQVVVVDAHLMVAFLWVEEVVWQPKEEHGHR